MQLRVKIIIISFNDKPIFIITNKFFRNFIIDIIRQNDKINHVVSLYVLKLYFADILIYDSWNQQVKTKLKKKDKIQQFFVLSKSPKMRTLLSIVLSLLQLRQKSN